MYVYFVGGRYSKSYSRACLFLLPRHDSPWSLLCNPNTPYSGGWNSTSLWHGWALQILHIDRSQENFLPGIMELNHICVPYRIHAKRALCRLLNSLYIFFPSIFCFQKSTYFGLPKLQYLSSQFSKTAVLCLGFCCLCYDLKNASTWKVRAVVNSPLLFPLSQVLW